MFVMEEEEERAFNVPFPFIPLLFLLCFSDEIMACLHEENDVRLKCTGPNYPNIIIISPFQNRESPVKLQVALQQMAKSWPFPGSPMLPANGPSAGGSRTDAG